MDGIQEASNQSDSAVSNASVSCVVALLGTLEDLSNGCGLSEENVEMLRKLKEPDNIQELSGNFSFKTKNIVGLVIQWFSINEFCRIKQELGVGKIKNRPRVKLGITMTQV